MPQGGLARRATLIRQVREAAQGPVLVLDAGNTLMGGDLASQSEGRLQVEAMNLMGYDALAVGPLELSKGIEVLQERAAEAAFAVLACNLVWSESQAPVLEPYIILGREGLRLAIIGVTNAEALQGLERLSPGVALLDPVERVAHYVAEVRPQADVVVVLSYLGLEADRALAGAVEGIDVIVGGRSRRLLREPQVVNGTAIIQAGYDGEWLGRLEIGGYVHALETVGYDVLYMRPEVADDPALAELIGRYQPDEGAEE